MEGLLQILLKFFLVFCRKDLFLNEDEKDQIMVTNSGKIKPKLLVDFDKLQCKPLFSTE